jgi:fermentation-respiration switch protein FrsA (DUF1100 family)
MHIQHRNHCHRPLLKRTLPTLLALLLFPLVPATSQPTQPSPTTPRQTPQPADPAGAWEGAIRLPIGELSIRVELATRGEGDGWTGTIDIPQQGARGLTLNPVQVEGPRVRFTIQGVPGDPTFDGTVEGDTLAGSFTQGDANLSFVLERTDAPAPELRRPQLPEPPFPYRSEEVRVESGEVVLAGTLTLPDGEGPFPGVVLLTGSGPQDRDETLAGHKLFLVLADHLTRRGIAVLRLDDRGVGGSTGDLQDASLADLAKDAAAALGFLAKRPEVAAERVGLLGHSEGGLVAPLATIGDVGHPPAFLVLLAAPGVPAAEVVATQLGWMLRTQGVAPESSADAADALVTAGVSILRNGGDKGALSDRLRAVAATQSEGLSTSDRTVVMRVAELLAAQFAALQVPQFQDFLERDPRTVLRAVRVPVLALNGGLDLQVSAEQNLTTIEEALKAGGNPDVTARTLPGLNHLFQHATTGNLMEYGQIEETMSPEVLEIISSWIAERFAGAGAPAGRPTG